jgi:hypothetical protein
MKHLFLFFILTSCVSQENKRSAELDEGGLTRYEIEDVIKSSIPDVKNCFKEGMNYGRIIFFWIINENGRVKKVKVESNTSGELGLERCVSEVIKSYHFPSPRKYKEVSVAYPFLFISKRDKK